MKTNLLLLATAALGAATYLGVDLTVPCDDCDEGAPAPASPVASELSAGRDLAPVPPSVPARPPVADESARVAATFASLEEPDRELVTLVADLLGDDPRTLADWAVERDAVRDLRELHSLLDDDGGRPHMGEAFAQYVALRDQLPVQPGR